MKSLITYRLLHYCEVEGEYKALLSAINMTSYKLQQLPGKSHGHTVITREEDMMAAVVQNPILAG
jgi:hypothetical protein